MDYNFARRKTSSTNPKSVAHIWELGGDINEPKLLEVPITVNNLKSASVVICCDLSKPQNCLASLLKWIKLIKNVVDKRLREMQSFDAIAATAYKESILSSFKNEEIDFLRLKPLEISLYIVANKYDQFKTQSSADRRLLMQVLRFTAHYYGATLITTSVADASLKETFRLAMTGILFKSNSKPMCDTILEKPIFISSGKDDFETILLANSRTLVMNETTENGEVTYTAVSSVSSTSGKNRLANSHDDLSLYLTKNGITRDCWDRFAEHIKSVFGTINDDKNESKNNEDDMGGVESAGVEEGIDHNQNDYPEPEIDEIRSLKDAALERYVQVCMIILLLFCYVILNYLLVKVFIMLRKWW